MTLRGLLLLLRNKLQEVHDYTQEHMALVSLGDEESTLIESIAATRSLVHEEFVEILLAFRSESWPETQSRNVADAEVSDALVNRVERFLHLDLKQDLVSHQKPF